MNEFVIYWSDLTKEAQARILDQCHLSFRLSLTRPATEYGDDTEKMAILKSKIGNKAITPVVITPALPVNADVTASVTTESKPEAKPAYKKPENHVKEKGMRGRHISASERRRGLDFIGEHSKVFGGTMSRSELERELGVSHATIDNWIKQVSKELGQNA